MTRARELERLFIPPIGARISAQGIAHISMAGSKDCWLSGPDGKPIQVRATGEVR